MKPRVAMFIASFTAVLGATSAVYCFTQQAAIHYYPAHRLFEHRDYEKAIPLYEKCLKTSPAHPKALKELAFAYQWLGQYDKSIATFKKSLRQDPKNPRTKKSLAQILAWQGRYEESIAYFQEMVDQQADDETLRDLAQTYLWNHQWERAQKILEDLYARNPKDMQTRMLLARVLQYSGKVEQAIPLYQKVLQKQTANLDAVHGLAESYMSMGDFKAAIKNYQQVLSAKPQDTKAQTALADVLSWQKNYPEAIAEYEKILAREPDNEIILRKMADAYEWKLDFSKAATLYEKLLGRHPDSAELTLALAENYSAQKRFQEALALLNQGLEKTADPKLRLIVARTLLFTGDFEQAKNILKELLSVDPGNAEAKTYLADAFAAQKKFTEAIRLYREVLAQKPGDSKVLIQLADVLSWDKHYGEALKLYDQLAADTGDVRVEIQKARVLGWARRYQDALAEYQRIYAKSPLEIVSLEMKAKKAYWNHRVDAARDFYERLIEKDPENSEALFDLSQLFSYRGIWDKAIQNYEKILAASPAHFRGREGLEKAKQMAFAPMVRTGYEFFESDSAGRENDIRKHTERLRVEMPLTTKLRAGIEENLIERSFADFRNLIETESKIDLLFTPNLNFSGGAFFSVLTESAAISPLYLFGVHLSARVLDAGQSVLSYERKRLENNSSVIRSRMFQDEFKERLEFDLNKRLVFGTDYALSRVSDGNVQNQAGADILYYLSLDPRRLAIKYRAEWQGFGHGASQYFAPASLWRGAVTVDWKHYLGREEIFFGTKDFYYEVEYEAALDSLDIASHKFTGKIGYDFTQQLGIELKVSYTNSSASVYQDKSGSGSVHVYF